METFRQFFESKLAEEDKNLKTTLQKLPQRHRTLVKGYSYEFQQGNTLKNDDEHVGYIDDDKKKIAVAAPWHYGREFTFLHEIAHKVWAILDEDKRKEWRQIAKANKECKEPAEEAFCMAYANFYSKHQVVIYNNPQWNKFIESLPK